MSSPENLLIISGRGYGKRSLQNLVLQSYLDQQDISKSLLTQLRKSILIQKTLFVTSPESTIMKKCQESLESKLKTGSSWILSSKDWYQKQMMKEANRLMKLKDLYPELKGSGETFLKEGLWAQVQKSPSLVYSMGFGNTIFEQMVNEKIKDILLRQRLYRIGIKELSLQAFKETKRILNESKLC